MLHEYVENNVGLSLEERMNDKDNRFTYHSVFGSDQELKDFVQQVECNFNGNSVVDEVIMIVEMGNFDIELTIRDGNTLVGYDKLDYCVCGMLEGNDWETLDILEYTPQASDFASLTTLATIMETLLIEYLEDNNYL